MVGPKTGDGSSGASLRRRLALFSGRVLVPCVLAATASWAHAAEILFADGRRETVGEPIMDGKGAWTAIREGRRTALKPGDVIAVIDDAGTENVTIPALADPPDAPGAAAALASLKDPKNDAWRQAAEQLGARPTTALFDAVVALASDVKREMRSRAITALAELRTREGARAAASAVLSEKDPGLRREAASVLFSVGEIVRRSDAKDLIQRGITDKDPIIRIVFAMLSPRDLVAATAVLRADGLTSGDHHVRESAAVELGLRGDGSGEGLLVAMLSRARLPGVDEPALMERLMTREKVEICGILGKLASATAKAALRRAAASGSDPVRRAAAAALTAAGTK